MPWKRMLPGDESIFFLAEQSSESQFAKTIYEGSGPIPTIPGDKSEGAVNPNPHI